VALERGLVNYGWKEGSEGLDVDAPACHILASGRIAALKQKDLFARLGQPVRCGKPCKASPNDHGIQFLIRH
jgi:hypothetical protein